jgi:hypothetical protein
MTRLWNVSIRSYNILLDLQSRIPREFEPCWIQEPFILTDVLGRVAPVHLELINSWEVLDSVLAARFRDCPSERKIRNKEYALSDRTLQRDIERHGPFETSFLPGRRIDMSLIFKRQTSSGASCPGCGTQSDLDNAMSTTWYRISPCISYMTNRNL